MVEAIQSIPPANVNIYNEQKSETNGQKFQTESKNEKPAVTNNLFIVNNNSAETSKTDENSTETAQKTTEKEKEKKSNSDFDKLASQLKDYLGEDNVMIEFSIDKETKRMVMRLIDRQTDEVIKQYPPEVSLKIARIVASTMEDSHVTNATV